MKIDSQYTRRSLLALMLLFGLALGGCEKKQSPTATGGARKPVIAVSLFPIYSIVESLVGDWADVQLLLPPGASEHGFELTPVQLEQVSNADALVIVGMNMDNWAENAVKKSNRNLEVIRFADLIASPAAATTAPADDEDHNHDHDHDHEPASTQAADDHEHSHDHGHDHHHHGPNNHLWLDPLRTADFVNKLGNKLLPYFPSQQAALKGRTLMYSSNIISLHQRFEAQAARFPQKNLVTFHNAFDLLAERYGLTVVAHLAEVEVSPGGEVTPQELVEAIKAVKEHKLAVVYAEPQFPDRAMRAIEEETGVKVLKLDPLGNPNIEGYRTYMDMMKTNFSVLLEGQHAVKK